jgi:hypothetical protein
MSEPLIHRQFAACRMFNEMVMLKSTRSCVPKQAKYSTMSLLMVHTTLQPVTSSICYTLSPSHRPAQPEMQHAKQAQHSLTKTQPLCNTQSSVRKLSQLNAKDFQYHTHPAFSAGSPPSPFSPRSVCRPSHTALPSADPLLYAAYRSRAWP